MDRHREIMTALDTSNQAVESMERVALAAIENCHPDVRKLAQAIKEGNAERLEIAMEGKPTLEVTSEMTARLGRQTVLGGEEEMEFRLYGVEDTPRNRIKLDHPEAEGKTIYADIQDPEFDSSPNIYLEAYNDGEPLLLRVQMRRDARTRSIRKIYVNGARKVDGRGG